MHVLALNSGSSSLKYALFAIDDSREERLAAGSATDAAAAFAAIEALPRPDAVGHRLVHGGPEHRAPEVIDVALRRALEEVVRFAPLHLPAELAVIDAATARYAGALEVACFDTAFHAQLPEVARGFAIPRALHDEGVRRYGFHGLSYEHVVDHVGAQALGRAVIAHLGSGASLAAVRDGVSIDTTMGLTPAGGVMMGTRSGDLDPGVLLYVMQNHGYGAREIDLLVNHRSGLLGVSGTTSDMRALLAARASDERAAAAVAMFCYSVRKSIGALAAALDGLDSLVFTGGIGERAPEIREEICRGLGHLGVHIDAARNEASAPIIGDRGATVRVVRTDEERMVARRTHRLAQ